MAILVGIITFVLIGLFGYSFYYVASSKGYFDKKFYVSLETNQADYFDEGMGIFYKGFKIGYIKKIELQDNGNVIMNLEFNEKNRKWLREDAVFVLDKPLIGSAKIRVDSDPNKPLIGNGVSMNIAIKDSINQLIKELEPVTAMLQKIMINVDKTTLKFAKDEPLLETLMGDKKTIKAINDVLDNLNKTLLSSDMTINKINNETLTKSNNLIDNLNDKTLKKVDGSIDSVNEILKDVQQKMKKLDSTFDMVDTLSPDVTEMKNQVKATLKKTDDLMEKVDAYLDDYNQREVPLQ